MREQLPRHRLARRSAEGAGRERGGLLEDVHPVHVLSRRTSNSPFIWVGIDASTLAGVSAHSVDLRVLRVDLSSSHRLAMPYFRRIVRTLSRGIAWIVRPRLVTEVAMNIEL